MRLLKHHEPFPDQSILWKDLALNFNLEKSQLTVGLTIFNQSELGIVMTFRLTSMQSLAVSRNRRRPEISSTILRLQKLFQFRSAFDINLSSTNYTVYRVQIYHLACFEQRVYTFGEYAVIYHQNKRIYVNSTGATYEPNEYYFNTAKSKPTVTVCSKLLPSSCNASYVKLNSSEYHLLLNLTLIYHSWKYDFGNYTNMNGTVFICVEFQRNYTKCIRKGPASNFALGVIPCLGFSFSLACLFALIVTYLTFKELRTLPGKNLMNLSVSLFLAELFWLCGGELTENQTVCLVIAIVDHYFYLAFFTASSVIAYHSCVVFGRSISFRRNQTDEQRLFFIYCMLVWVFPALFVLASFLLDHYGLFVVNYGKYGVCWLGTRNSRLFLFIFPLGSLLLFNLALFVFVFWRLCKNQRSSAQVLGNDSSKRFLQHVVVCIKLSTLMGFEWTIALVNFAIGDGVNLLTYFFVVFVSLQYVELYRKMTLGKVFGVNSLPSQGQEKRNRDATNETKF